ncbi:hypothetical protein, partial [Paenibacillus amylolyticus]|uniref:hypothetical protein n=1 Tax=Paenibacillus amylolyticus TaxID=1451 RepID=UPI001C37D185
RLFLEFFVISLPLFSHVDTSVSLIIRPSVNGCPLFILAPIYTLWTRRSWANEPESPYFA